MSKSVERASIVQKATRPHKAKPIKPRTIETIADIRAGAIALRKVCPSMRRIHDLVGDPPLRRNASGFVGLAQVVVGQQLSIASAAAIWKRVVVAVDPFDAPTLLAQSDATLRGAGLSQGKVRTLRAAAEAVRSGALRLDERQSDETLREALLGITGIGPWTADIYTMFCLGHADGFAPGDLALQIAAQRALDLDCRPSAQDLVEIAERWRPWRGVAARLLWAFYVHRA
ncbi:DNA-3-methyladenine glycosylase 2 family protein [Hyphomicrobium sp.]|uniref:DNA-3-methyladenine glycosylase family protein n=1 Tax=Hyphomicrobium sp. TaxID=82 RepID=UPI002E311AC7|nr:DNA-3-methyladenine glycosylase 2 family protein [Hyphomicrobium sp.]HEX2841620.1 DNA-3-methyladenine glycosylase 2 family protein [Hyphomicrobium sp.]